LSKQTYLDLQFDLLTKPEDEEEVSLPPEDYTYSFSFKLAENLPSSFNHAIGKIAYNISVTLSAPWYHIKVS
jgi:hypothetical protein